MASFSSIDCLPVLLPVRRSLTLLHFIPFKRERVNECSMSFLSENILCN